MRLNVVSRNPFQGGMGFFTRELLENGYCEACLVAIPFRVGWGFSHSRLPTGCLASRKLRSQSLSGWDGVFHAKMKKERSVLWIVSQSLSGWDGVFHISVWLPDTPEEFRSQSLSGWDGVFHGALVFA